MLLGSAMLAAVAAGAYADIDEAMSAMSELGDTYVPLPETAAWHERRFRAFEMLQAAGRALRGIAAEGDGAGEDRLRSGSMTQPMPLLAPVHVLILSVIDVPSELIARAE